MDTYFLIIGISLTIILSYLFNIISKKTNIPSVLMLIVLGVAIKQGLNYFDVPVGDFEGNLEILGTIGVIMIVLEAALDLELSKEKWPIIWKSFAVALIALIASTFAVAALIDYFIPGAESFTSLVYAVPLSVMSSAIIIPSVGKLVLLKKEFMIYESTFSDILGIMFFYFLTNNAKGDAAEALYGFAGEVIITVVLSVIISFGLIYIFHRLKTEVKLFLIISSLTLLYAVGKKFGLSSLIIILFFGLILNNFRIFFVGPLKKHIDEEAIKKVLHDFHIVTRETAFIVRTFFFVIFGFSIVLGHLLSMEVALLSVLILVALYGVRWVLLRLFVGQDIIPQLWIAPRGLITILLFFAIPAQYHIEKFDPGVLLFTIIISSLVMTASLIIDKSEPEGEEDDEEELAKHLKNEMLGNGSSDPDSPGEDDGGNDISVSPS